MTMECLRQNERGAEVMVAYVARQLEPTAQIELERHLTACAVCRNWAAEQQAVWDALDAWTPALVSADFDEKLYSRIAEDERGQTGWRRFSRINWTWAFRPAIPVAAACAVLVALFVLRGPLEEPQAQPGHEQQVAIEQKVSIEQVQRALDDVDMLKQLSLTATAQASGRERI
jgi:anti-sigma factor RsiW